MSATAARLPRRQMTVEEFLAWDPGDGTTERRVLRDGEPEMMAPASERVGAIQARLAQLFMNHLESRDSPCRVITAPGVIPRMRAAHNMLCPDLGITCEPAPTAHAITNPVVLVEILSPSNETETRANVWAFATIPSVREILILHSTRIAAELLRRAPDGSWPEQPDMLGPDDALRLPSIGYAAPLRAAYHTAGLG